MKCSATLGFATLALISANCLALKLDIKPGLWEHRFKLNESSLGSLEKQQQEQLLQVMGKMQKRLADMPPEQRQQIEAMMKQQGIDTSGLLGENPQIQLSAEGTLVKECVTQAQIDRGELPAPEKNCKNTIQQKSNNQFKVTYACAGGEQAQGTVEVTFQNPRSYTGQVAYSLNRGGKRETLQGEMSGRWLASDCGSIKPGSGDAGEDTFGLEE